MITALTITGILLTVFFGLWGIYVLARSSKYPGQITLVRESTLALFDTIVRHFPEIAISHKGAPVSEGLVLFRAAILNTGSKDITPEMTAGRLTLTLPDGFKWLNAKVVSASPGVHGKVERSSQAIGFDLGLLRCKEFVRFEALSEVPPAQKDKDDSDDPEALFRNAVRASHRIADTQKVIVTDLPTATRAKRRFKMFLPLVLLTAALLIAFTLSGHFLGWPAKMCYDTRTDDGQLVLVKATLRMNGMAKVKGIEDKSFKKTMGIQEFVDNARVSPALSPDPDIKLILITGGIYIIIPLLLCLYAIREQRRARLLRDLLLIGAPAEKKKANKTQQEAPADKE